MKVTEGELKGEGLRFAIVVSRFNSLITRRLLDGAMDCLTRHGVEEKGIEIFYVPGAFEIPLAAKKLGSTGRYDAIICIGAVIRGDTPHFEYVASEVAKGVAKVSLDLDLPVTFGVLTTDTIEQAIERAGTKAGNKGFDAALSAIEMVNLLKKV